MCIWRILFSPLGLLKGTFDMEAGLCVVMLGLVSLALVLFRVNSASQDTLVLFRVNSASQDTLVHSNGLHRTLYVGFESHGPF